MSSRKQLGQFFTPIPIADKLIGCLSEPVSKVLDLGAGSGSLGKSLLSKYPNSAYIGIEKDIKYFEQCSRSFESHSILCGDVISNDVKRLIGNRLPVDTIIGNPPFYSTKQCQKNVDVIKSVFPTFKPSGDSLRAELIFLATSMDCLKLGGQASFILPSAFATSNSYLFFRKHLIENCSEITVFNLPDKIFSSAEVSTSIIYFKNSKSNNQYINLGKINVAGEVVDLIRVPSTLGIQRMDYSFHKSLECNGFNATNELETLESIGGKVFRGSVSRAKLAEQKIKYFHTTSFPKNQPYVVLDDDVDERFKHAKQGDILAARVGSRCLDKQVLVTSGSRAITDCVFRINVPDDKIDQVMRTLSSDYGKAWRQINAQGSCARYITKSTILSMPLMP